MNKKNIVQMSAGIIVIGALILNIFVLGSGNHEKGERKNPLEITKFEDIDERFLERLTIDSGMSIDQIKTEMELESNSGKTLFSILEEKGIVIKGPENSQRNNGKQRGEKKGESEK